MTCCVMRKSLPPNGARDPAPPESTKNPATSCGAWCSMGPPCAVSSRDDRWRTRQPQPSPAALNSSTCDADGGPSPPTSPPAHMRLLLLTLVCGCLLQATVAVANTSHDGWPDINGVTLMNKNDDARPLDARPGHDPFAGQDTDYTCDEVHMRAGGCQNRFVDSDGGD